MAATKSKAIAKHKTVAPKSAARSIPIAEGGIYDSTAFANLMSALMTDLVTGAISPEVGNAACNASGKLLKIVEMQQKYGGKLVLALAGPGPGK